MNKLTLLFKKLKIFCCTSKQSLKDIQEIEQSAFPSQNELNKVNLQKEQEFPSVPSVSSVPKKLVVNVPDKLPKTKVPYPLTPLPSPRPL